MMLVFKKKIKLELLVLILQGGSTFNAPLPFINRHLHTCIHIHINVYNYIFIHTHTSETMYRWGFQDATEIEARIGEWGLQKRCSADAEDGKNINRYGEEVSVKSGKDRRGCWCRSGGTAQAKWLWTIGGADGGRERRSRQWKTENRAGANYRWGFERERKTDGGRRRGAVGAFCWGSTAPVHVVVEVWLMGSGLVQSAAQVRHSKQCGFVQREGCGATAGTWAGITDGRAAREGGGSVRGGRTEAQRERRAGCRNRWKNSRWWARSVNIFYFFIVVILFYFFSTKEVVFVESQERRPHLHLQDLNIKLCKQWAMRSSSSEVQSLRMCC